MVILFCRKVKTGGFILEFNGIEDDAGERRLYGVLVERRAQRSQGTTADRRFTEQETPGVQ